MFQQISCGVPGDGLKSGPRGAMGATKHTTPCERALFPKGCHGCHKAHHPLCARTLPKGVPWVPQSTPPPVCAHSSKRGAMGATKQVPFQKGCHGCHKAHHPLCARTLARACKYAHMCSAPPSLPRCSCMPQVVKHGPAIAPRPAGGGMVPPQAHSGTEGRPYASARVRAWTHARARGQKFALFALAHVHRNY